MGTDKLIDRILLWGWVGEPGWTSILGEYLYVLACLEEENSLISFLFTSGFRAKILPHWYNETIIVIREPI